MRDAEFEPFIVPKIIQLHNAHFESKIIQETIPAYREFIRNAPIEHLKELRTTLKAIVRNPPPAEAPPDYEKDMGDDALAPPKDDDEEDVVISESDEPGKHNNLPEKSDDINQRTMHRSEVHMNKEGKPEVICYDCSTKMLWTSYDRHLTSKTHAHNARERAKKRSVGNGLKKKNRVIRGRGKPMDINKLRAAIKAIVN
jgi:hypothetical protein